MRLLPLLCLPLLISCGDKDTGTPADDTGSGGEGSGEEGGEEGGGEEGGDDGSSDACPTSVVTFTGTDGAAKDVTSFFESGEYLTLAVPGTLEVCPGTWFSRVLIRADVDVIGLGAAPKDTILSGGESGTILDIAGPDVTVNVTNLRFDRGAGLDVDHNSGGGGIYCEQDGTIIATDLIFTDNFANDGSAIYTRDCIVDMTGVVMKDNLAEDDGGAATFWSSTVTMQDVRIENNTALDGGGMALFNSTFTGTDMNIEGNTSTNFGGGVWVYDSEFNLSNTTVTGNSNTGSDFGGGILLFGEGTLTNVSFTNNTAPKGGGLFVYYEAKVTGSDCDFSGNSPEDIWVADYSSAGGYAMSAGAGYSFTCANNVCTEQ